MDNEIMKINSFPVADGHIESILIGCDDVKVSFQSWNAKKIVIIFRNCEKIISSHSVYGDIGKVVCSDYKKGLYMYSFYDSCTNGKVLEIVAESIEIYEVGTATDGNSALFDVGYDYIGNQECPYYD